MERKNLKDQTKKREVVLVITRDEEKREGRMKSRRKKNDTKGEEKENSGKEINN